MPKMISVIVPVYNVERYLARCLNSILNNTYTNLEVICINDGSTDSSLEILKEYKKIDKRIIIFNQENKGIAAARNRGLSYAHGDYISFVDSDDWVHKYFFETLLSFCENNHTDIAMCKYIVTQLDCIQDNEIEPEMLPCTIIKGDDVVLNMWTRRGYVWNCLYNKDCLDGLQFPNFQIEDIPFKIQLFANGEGNLSISFIDSELYYYFQRNNSSVRFRNAETNLEIYDYLLDQFEQETKSASQRIYILYLSKRLMRYRYEMMYEFTKSTKNTAKKIAKRCASDLLHSSCGIDWKYKIIHITLLRHASLYRLFRIINDPSMIRYEKQMKTGVTQLWNRFKTSDHD